MPHSTPDALLMANRRSPSGPAALWGGGGRSPGAWAAALAAHGRGSTCACTAIGPGLVEQMAGETVGLMNAWQLNVSMSSGERICDGIGLHTATDHKEHMISD